MRKATSPLSVFSIAQGGKRGKRGKHPKDNGQLIMNNEQRLPDVFAAGAVFVIHASQYIILYSLLFVLCHHQTEKRRPARTPIFSSPLRRSSCGGVGGKRGGKDWRLKDADWA